MNAWPDFSSFCPQVFKVHCRQLSWNFAALLHYRQVKARVVATIAKLASPRQLSIVYACVLMETIITSTDICSCMHVHPSRSCCTNWVCNIFVLISFHASAKQLPKCSPKLVAYYTVDDSMQFAESADFYDVQTFNILQAYVCCLIIFQYACHAAIQCHIYTSSHHVQNTTTLWYSNVCLAHSMTRLLNLAHDLLSSDSQSWADLAMKWMKSSKAVVAKSALSSLAGRCHPSSLSGEWTSSPQRRFRWCLQGTHLDLQSVLNTPLSRCVMAIVLVK